MAQLKVNANQALAKAVNVFTGGAWQMNKKMKVFVSGLWTDVISYKKGILMPPTAYYNFTLTSDTGGTFTYQSATGAFHFTATRIASDYNYSAYRSDGFIDLTSYNTLVIDASISVDGAYGDLRVIPDAGGTEYVYNRVEFSSGPGGRKRTVIDISTIIGNCDITINMRTAYNVSATYAVYELYVE